MKNTSDANVTVAFNHQYRWDQEIASTKWLSKNRDKNAKVYSDYEASNILNGYGMLPFESQRHIIRAKTTQMNKRDYVYLRYMNIVNNVMIEPLPKYRSGVYNIYSTTEIYYRFKEKGKIYGDTYTCMGLTSQGGIRSLIYAKGASRNNYINSHLLKLHAK